jgi:isopentenyldiphosphate isomerase
MNSDPGDELIDRIDEEGRTVGTMTRCQMRAGRLPHRCVYLLVFNHRGELFIHLRTGCKDIYPAHWDVTVGGVVLAGETFEDGAVRELAEELGIAAAPELLFPFQYEDAATVVRAQVYRVVHEGPFRLQPEEVERGEFVSLTDVPARAAAVPFCPDGLAVLAAYEKAGYRRRA